MTNKILIEAPLLPNTQEDTDSLTDEQFYRQLMRILNRDIAPVPDVLAPDWSKEADSVDFEDVDDGTTYYHQLPFDARTMYVLSLSTSPFTVQFDNRRVITIPGGFMGAIPIPAVRGYRITSTLTFGIGSIVITFYRERFKPTLLGNVNLGGNESPTGANHVTWNQIQGSAGPAATLLVPANPARTSCSIKNTDMSANIWVGGTSLVTTANGYGPIQPAASWVFTAKGNLYFIADIGTPIISFWDESN